MLHHLIFIAAIVTVIAFLIYNIYDQVVGLKKHRNPSHQYAIHYCYVATLIGAAVVVLLEVVFLIHHHRVDIYPRW